MLPFILGTFVFCFVLERLAPGWQLRRVKTWAVCVVAVNAVQLGQRSHVTPASSTTCGFEDFREQQLLPMLAYSDVHADDAKRTRNP